VHSGSTSEGARRNPPPVCVAWRITLSGARSRDSLANPPFGYYFFPSCRAASASIMRSSQLASERPSAFARRSAVALTDSLTRTFIAVSRLSDFGFFIPAF
jgi:hypothetical protein